MVALPSPVSGGSSGHIAVEAQLTSVAERHLQIRLGNLQTTRGDGWVLFQAQPLGEDYDLNEEVQRLCTALARDVTNRTCLRLAGEDEESDLASLVTTALRFNNLLATAGDSEGLPENLDELPPLPSIQSMLKLLYHEVVSDVGAGVHGVTDFPRLLCPAGKRFDVLIQKSVCIKAFTQTEEELIPANHAKKHLPAPDWSLANSFSTGAQPPGPLAKIWLDTRTMAHALSMYSNAPIENELPSQWRSKSFSIPEAREVLGLVQEALILFWNRNSNTERTRQKAMALLSIVSGDLREYIKSRIALHGVDWRGPWRMPLEDLQKALELTIQWKAILSQLTKKDWSQWNGGSYRDESFEQFMRRLADVVRIRELVASITQLKERVPNEMLPESVFEGVSLTSATSASASTWEECVSAFNKQFSFTEPMIRKNVRALFSGACGDAQVRQLLLFSTLLRQECISSTVEKELEGIAGYMKQQLSAVQKRTDNNIRRATTPLQKLRATKSCAAECGPILENAYKLFGSSPLLDSVVEHAMGIVQASQRDEQTMMSQWRSSTEAQCEKICNSEEAVVVRMIGSSNLLQCIVHQSIRQLLQEVRNMQCWCGEQSAAHLQLGESAQNTILACEQLVAAASRTQQAVSNLNTVLQEILPYTRSMLHSSIQRAISQILYTDTSSRAISLGNHQELEGLNLRFQHAVESLSNENRHVRRFHCEFISQVAALHNVDLTKHMDQWRTAVDGMRSSFEEFLHQHRCKHYEDWRRHLDCQIYKALEYQYRRGLETLHENMEEFKVELVFKQGQLQFKPSFEAMREAYYIKLREFVSVPLRFRGLQPKRTGSEPYEVYPQMPLNNRVQIITVHTKAIELFAKLNRVRKAFRAHTALGLCATNPGFDLDTIVEMWVVKERQYHDAFNSVEEHLEITHRIEDHIKVDCFSVSTIPVKASMEEQIHRLQELVLNNLRKAIQQSLTEIDDFVTAAIEVVDRQPTTMDEVALTNKAFHDHFEHLGLYETLYAEASEMNATLRHYSGATVDLGATKHRWALLRDLMPAFSTKMEASVAKMRVSLDGIIQKFLKDVERFSSNWSKQKGQLLGAFEKKKTDQIVKMLAGLKDQMSTLDDLNDQYDELMSKCNYFNQPKPNFSMLVRTAQDVKDTLAMLSLHDDFEAQLASLRQEDWLTFRSHMYQFDDFCSTWRTALVKHTEDQEEGSANKENVIAHYLLNLLKDWAEVLPLLKFVRGEGWMTEHWNEMFRLLGMEKGVTSTSLTFGAILDHYQAVLERQGELKELHARAVGEIQVREGLQELRTWGLESTFTLTTPSEDMGKVKLITEWKDVMTQVSDNQALINSLKDSPFYSHFADEANGWETKLASLATSLVLLNNIQRKWAYLEPIFSRGALPQEQARFKRVDKEFVSILREVEADPRVMSLASQFDLNDKLRGVLEQIDRCQKSLMEYLDAKRDQLPRFYFISDEDLLDILGHSQDPTVIQAHLKKLFMGIHSVVFNEDQTAITHMVSSDHESVELLQPVSVTEKGVEDWLIRLDDCMRETLRHLLVRCLEEKDPCSDHSIRLFPSQILQVAQQVIFSGWVEDAIGSKTLDKLLHSQQKQLGQLTGMSGRLDEVTGLKVRALILDMIHNIEIVELLIDKKVRHVREWWWQKQLRYYMNEKKRCAVHMVDTVFDYTYEYQGNAAKLVHTPLTDKCYLVLTKGMDLGYGGNPYGPAGTGKTESVKALGSAMGRQVLVFNCDEGIDFKAMGRIFVGIVKCGAWGCFDEFNRLKVDQLSAISQMIQVIQETLKNREPSCLLLNKSVDVNPNAGIFVTLNPAGKGYGGRTKLPDNLKQLFREVAMSVPDNALITSSMLLSEGFTKARPIAKKVVELYKLCQQLMSHQQHYDWGLRPLKAVLRLAGSLMQRRKSEGRDNPVTEAEEEELIVQSLNINTLSKLTFDDARLFNGLIANIFPTINARDIAYEELEKAIHTAIQALGLQSIRSQVSKVLQLYEAMNQRMGVVLVGPSGSGKSTVLRILRKALEMMNVEVPLYAVNPKSMPRRQLLGYMDTDTREWFDGVLTLAAREVVKQPKESRPWVLCDGDIDPEWIESLNSVLDDNKLLTMPNGVRIQFGSNVNFIFETHSLEFASPATVSRMGVLFFSSENVNLEMVVDSFLQAQPEDVRKRVGPFMMKHLFAAISEAISMDMFSVSTTPMGLLNACLSHVLSATNESDFVYSLIRGLCSTLTATEAPNLAKRLYEMFKQTPVSDSRPLDTYWDAKAKGPREYTADLSATISPSDMLAGNAPVIKTVEVQRLFATLRPLITDKACKPIFLVGPEGCGKGSLLKQCFSEYDGIRTTVINCSAQTTSSHVIQKLDQMCVIYSTNAGHRYRPKEGDRLVLMLKNVNLPKPDKYGTVELHSFLQQLILYRGFYNKELEWMSIEHIQIAASMNPITSAGRYPVAPRLLAVVNIITVPYPSKTSLLQICTAYWAGLLKSTEIGQGKSYDNGRELAQFVISVFDKIRRRFEGEEYAHCLFCPRSITKWIVNTLLYKIDAQTTLPAVLGYEAQRIFSDCLPQAEDRQRADKVFAEQLATIGYSLPSKEEKYAMMFATWFTEPLPNGSRRLEQAKYTAVATEIEGGLLRYSREFKALDMTVIPEVVAWVTRVDRVLARPGGHLILVGRPGVGRRNAVALAAYMQRMETVTLHMATDYGLKQFRHDLAHFIQRAITQNDRLVLVLEDYQIIEETFLEMVNGLVNNGEVPGLFTPEEMEMMMSPLRDEAANEGFMGPMYTFFLERLQRNLRVALIMDNRHELFNIRLQSNPGLLSSCDVLWMGAWSRDTATTMCKARLKDTIAVLEADSGNKGFHLHREIYAVHESMGVRSTPHDFSIMMETYDQILKIKSQSSEQNMHRLTGGLEKLNEAEQSVGKIQKDVTAKKGEVEVMQKDADRALNEIQKSMENSQEQRVQAKELEDQLRVENEDIVDKRGKVAEELSTIQPMLEAARNAVSSIRSEQLNEIRSLKAPPEPIRDVLEGVLALLGVNDVSWQSMRKFLGERGAKERILEFDAKSVTPSIRSSVAKLLQQKATSFKPEVIHRASVAAAPMAEWVKAMIEYSTIMERIAPLTQQLEQLENNQRAGEKKLLELSEQLKSIDSSVESLRKEFSKKCKEAERLRAAAEKAEEELKKAQSLLDNLSGEKTRWADDANKIREANQAMPKRALIAAAFTVYLAQETEDVRQKYMKQWSHRVGFTNPMCYTSFLRAECDLLQFKAEGLPGDALSMENAIVMLESVQTPLVIDPANQAIEWVKEHLKTNNVVVEVASMHDERFAHTLELAIRFGKTLLVTEVGVIEPILYPVLRKDLISAGAKRVVQVGNKTVDWQDTFRVMLFCRSTDLILPPDAAALVTEVNFSITSMGLESQLLGLTIRHEQPELEEQKVELLKKEESLKLELSKLEERLLSELAESHGNLLENIQLVSSLDDVKAQANVIHEGLTQSHLLQQELDAKREVFRPFAHNGAVFFFLIKDLVRLNRMYQFGLRDFFGLFTRTLSNDKAQGDMSAKIEKLVLSLAQACFYRVSQGLFKKDQLAFGLHLLHGFKASLFPHDKWQALVGATMDVKEVEESQFPSWAPRGAKVKYAFLASCESEPTVLQKWSLDNGARWGAFMKDAAPETQLTELPLIEQLMLVNTFRPDRMTALCSTIVVQQLQLESLMSTVALEHTIVNSNAATPILLITSRGSDPSVEVQDTAGRIVGKQRLVQIALGGGQTDEAMQQLRRCAAQGDWIFLKNLHLVLDWASVLEKELCAMPEPHKDFRLIITTEQHEHFPSVLLSMSTKITIEAPPGVKQNLLGTYSMWDAPFLESTTTAGAQMLFGLAWFHAILQERRTFVPQGWIKYYEFSQADLKAATNVFMALVSKQEGDVDWETLQGLLQDCIYGGRLENWHDEGVLRLLIRKYFTESVLLHARSPLYKDIHVPTTNNYDAVAKLIVEQLPDVDPPGMFSLPDNAGRAVQENIAQEQMESLRELFHSTHKHDDGNDSWRKQLVPVVGMWKSSGLQTISLKRSVTGQSTNPDPMEVFFASEANLLLQLVADLSAYFAELQAVVDGTLIPPAALREEATELIGGRMPSRWLDRMDGPRESKLWLSLLSRKNSKVLDYMRSPVSTTTVYDLTCFLRPQTFLNAFRQHTAQQVQTPLVDLVLAAGAARSDVGQMLKVRVNVQGSTIALQGAVLGANGEVQSVTASSPTSAPLQTDIVMGWITQKEYYSAFKNHAEIPVFANSERQEFIFKLQVPCSSSINTTSLRLGGVAGYLVPV